MIAGAFDDSDGTRIAHRKALAGDAAEIAFALDRTVQHGIADDDRLFRHDLAAGGRPNDEAGAGEGPSDIIVGVPLKLKASAPTKEGAKASPGGARERRDNR